MGHVEHDSSASEARLYSERQPPLSSRLVSAFGWLSCAASVAVMVTAGTVLIGGWMLGNPGLQGLAPGAPKMMPNTSLGLLLSGASLFLWNIAAGKRQRVWAARVLAVAVAGLGAATGAQYLLGADLRIDELLFEDIWSGANYPGRPSPQTAIAFTMAGLALVLSGGKRLWMVWATQILGLATGFIALLASIGYVYGSLPFYGIAAYTGMAIPTVFGFLALSLGIVFARSDCGMTAMFTSAGGGGMMVRRLLPAIILIPLVLGGLRAWGEKAGVFSAEFGLALEAAVYIVALALPMWVFARVLERAEASRQAANLVLQDYSMRLAAVNEELNAFSYSVAHDLRAPLRSIHGLSQALVEDCAGRLTANSLDYIRRIQAASRHMDNLIDDLIRLSRIASHQMKLETVDLSAMAMQKAGELRAAEPGRQVEFIIREGMTAGGDAHLLRIALDNLLDNASKFTSKHPTARIEFGSSETNGSRIYFVRDDGAGLDMAYAQKLFKPFNRLHTADEFPGSGIGLTIVQRIIQRHGGRIWVDAAVEKGATFYFTLRAGGPGSIA